MPYTNLEAKGRPIAYKDEGVTIATNVASIDAVGLGIVATATGQDVSQSVSGAAGTQVSGETPSGTADGSNVTFTLAHTPVDTPRIFLNGVRQKSGAGNDYTISGDTITFLSAPLEGSNILVDYAY